MIMDAGPSARPFGMAHRVQPGLGCRMAALTGGSRGAGVLEALGCPWGPVPGAGVGHDPWSTLDSLVLVVTLILIY